VLGAKDVQVALLAPQLDADRGCPEAREDLAEGPFLRQARVHADLDLPALHLDALDAQRPAGEPESDAAPDLLDALGGIVTVSLSVLWT
jgi:hypothetical protein